LENFAAEAGAFSASHDSLYARIIVGEGFYKHYAKEIKAYQHYHSFQIPSLDAEHEWETRGVAESVSYYDPEMLNHPLRDQFLFVPHDFNGLKNNEVLVTPNTLASINYLEDHDGVNSIIYNKNKQDGKKYTIL